ncbi:PAS domain S-box protein [Anabaena cylindrica FACHB-243]|uniref:protein-glutamate O-methyltransferase n=1 Tax=Anabaena cylindrica (strain ATCC 27899 / PCC 7122) TaxID=272123 RepID=K9ZLA5_ANACC|nr:MULTISPECIES: CheR family methyltransferase [Anabaena]AFZ59564.1 MCP methyltransferase, CheR-type with PAS/PAC sensor [Anabaena cylindrica PCC 7122]MBD2418770.1 PAS domain S-box protein [Anabaena cylindrica FACHB-243]MBY5284756.1 PAS domain S-box protein [Anabaena sp. CCAP 1446/1C]MBY5310177.1 PAS domain S-box protein [Anabaena sp. CCAP 1446/1C]MCM2406335.1 PAS domain S-box protein [Anabaena sp. CCAP 1446/1C]
MTSIEKNPDFENLLVYLRQNRGFDFTGYKRSTLMRRVNKRMQSLSIESFVDYIDYLQVYPEEFNHLFNTILINVTDFFRDASAWECLAQQVIPDIIKNKKSSEPIRIWCAGCASGEEAYTLAILMSEALGAEDFRHRVKIYATDIDEEALYQARQAVYSAKNIHAISPELRDKYFELLGNNYLFRQDLRRSVIFGRHDLLQDAPISRLDLLVCRNTLMYFNSETQGRIMARFHFALNDKGYLFLGKAEMLSMYSNLFAPIDLKNRIFKRVSTTNVRDRLLVMANSVEDESSHRLSRYLRLRELAFDTEPNAKVVIDINGLLVMMNEQARILFSLSAKDLDRPFQDLELSYRPIELRSLIERAYNERRLIIITNVERYISNSETQYLDVRIIPLQDSDLSFLGVTIVFHDVTRYIKLQEALQRSRQELETTNEELQSTNEELETTNEELQSTNEELETTNEELQSTNQELETMNEELQSANEELQTINYELSQRTLELNHTNVFLISILRSLQTGIVVINKNFYIVIWNHLVEELWGLRNGEVINKSFFGLDIGLPTEQLRSSICDAISGTKHFQEMILDATNRRGKQIKCYLALTPLIDKEIEGVVLMMADIEKIKSMISAQEIEERRQMGNW